MDDSPDKVATLADVARALDRLAVNYAVAGGVAVGIRSGVPRATLDTDIAVPSTVGRSLLIEALTTAGLRLTGAFPHRMARRRSKALQDEADIALLRGDIPDPDEGW